MVQRSVLEYNVRGRVGLTKASEDGGLPLREESRWSLSFVPMLHSCELFAAAEEVLVGNLQAGGLGNTSR